MTTYQLQTPVVDEKRRMQHCLLIKSAILLNGKNKTSASFTPSRTLIMLLMQRKGQRIKYINIERRQICPIAQQIQLF